MNTSIIYHRKRRDDIMFDNTVPELLSIEELCDILCIGSNTAYTLLNSGELTGAFRIGRIWKIPKEAVSLYIKKKMSL